MRILQITVDNVIVDDKNEAKFRMRVVFLHQTLIEQRERCGLGWQTQKMRQAFDKETLLGRRYIVSCVVNLTPHWRPNSWLLGFPKRFQRRFQQCQKRKMAASLWARVSH
jgi:hypothetical protein